VVTTKRADLTVAPTPPLVNLFVSYPRPVAGHGLGSQDVRLRRNRHPALSTSWDRLSHQVAGRADSVFLGGLLVPLASRGQKRPSGYLISSGEGRSGPGEGDR